MQFHPIFCIALTSGRLKYHCVRNQKQKLLDLLPPCPTGLNDIGTVSDGDDVIIGGDGFDILRGDSIDSNDAAYAAWQAGIAEFNTANSDNAVTFDENMLSMDNSGTNAGDGNDVIVGGDGLDDIKSGDGQNFVTSGKADIDGDGQANLDLINQNIENHQHLLDDEDWV